MSIITTLPWLVIGDLNITLHKKESRGASRIKRLEIEKSVEAVNQARLVDVGFYGYPFTWSNHRNDAKLIEKRLDRGLANKYWLELFPDAKNFHLSAMASDHSPVILSTKQVMNDKAKPFKCFGTWLENESCIDVINDSWLTHHDVSPAFKVVKKLCDAKKNISLWNKTKFGNINLKLRQPKNDLECASKNKDLPNKSNILKKS